MKLQPKWEKLHPKRSCSSMPSADVTPHLHFLEKGKKSFPKTWKLLPDISTTFAKLGTVLAQSEIHDHDLKFVEKYFIALYSFKVQVVIPRMWTKLNESCGRSIENIQLTAWTLKQHTHRAALQANFWYKCLDKQRKPVSPVGWGWKKSETGHVLWWSELPEASDACKELIKCNCKKSCRGRCKCGKQGLVCTKLCAWAGQCAK